MASRPAELRATWPVETRVGLRRLSRGRDANHLYLVAEPEHDDDGRGAPDPLERTTEALGHSQAQDLAADAALAHRPADTSTSALQTDRQRIAGQLDERGAARRELDGITTVLGTRRMAGGSGPTRASSASSTGPSISCGGSTARRRSPPFAPRWEPSTTSWLSVLARRGCGMEPSRQRLCARSATADPIAAPRPAACCAKPISETAATASVDVVVMRGTGGGPCPWPPAPSDGSGHGVSRAKEPPRRCRAGAAVLLSPPSLLTSIPARAHDVQGRDPWRRTPGRRASEPRPVGPAPCICAM